MALRILTHPSEAILSQKWSISYQIQVQLHVFCCHCRHCRAVRGKWCVLIGCCHFERLWVVGLLVRFELDTNPAIHVAMRGSSKQLSSKPCIALTIAPPDAVQSMQQAISMSTLALPLCPNGRPLPMPVTGFYSAGTYSPCVSLVTTSPLLKSWRSGRLTNPR